MGAQGSRLLFRLARWVSTHLTATVITLVGIFTYSTLRISYSIFYGRFDVDPEEVGLGQSEILLQTAFGLAVFIAVVGVVLAVPYILARRVGRAFEAWNHHGVPPNASLEDRLFYRLTVFFAGPGRFLFVYLPLTAVAVILLAYFLPARARELADSVEHGEIIRPPSSLSGDLHVRALRVTLLSHDASNELPSQYRSVSLRYLGEAGGTVILYDWKKRETFRVDARNYDVITSK